jgi:hypothetical protein
VFVGFVVDGCLSELINCIIDLRPVLWFVRVHRRIRSVFLMALVLLMSVLIAGFPGKSQAITADTCTMTSPGLTSSFGRSFSRAFMSILAYTR